MLPDPLCRLLPRSSRACSPFHHHRHHITHLTWKPPRMIIQRRRPVNGITHHQFQQRPGLSRFTLKRAMLQIQRPWVPSTRHVPQPLDLFSRITTKRRSIRIALHPLAITLCSYDDVPYCSSTRLPRPPRPKTSLIHFRRSRTDSPSIQQRKGKSDQCLFGTLRPSPCLHRTYRFPPSVPTK